MTPEMAASALPRATATRGRLEELLCGERSVALAGRFGLLAVLAVVLTLPYAVPALWDFVAMKFNLARGYYLLKPVENQAFYLQFAMVAAGLPYVLWRAMAPPAFFPRNSLVMFVGLFVLLEFASVFVSRSPGFSLRGLMEVLAFLFFFLLVITSLPSRLDLEKIFFVAIVAAIPAALYAVAQSQGWEFLPYSKVVNEATGEEVVGKKLISSTFGHPNYMASFTAPLLFWGLFFVLRRRQWFLRIMGLLACLAITASLITAGTRGAWVAIIAGVIPFYLLIVLLPAYRRQLLFSGVLGMLVILLLLFVPNPLIKLQFNLSERLLASKEIGSRFYYWLIAVEMLRDNFLLGVGYGNYNLRFWEVVDQFQQQPGSEFYRFILTDVIRGVSPGFVHNDYLQIAAESGIISLATWMAIWSVVICQAWETARRAAAHDARAVLMAAAFLASLVSMGVDALFNFPFHIPVSGCFFFVMLGAWVIFRNHIARDESMGPLRPHLEDEKPREFPRVRF
ncbi:MAG: O-antigen ligase family protein [Candidatus Sumerlaeaceae bacterium]|nr:O-antigen ligase family protein [Candidatus Sumerlaeaceae bacterium]